MIMSISGVPRHGSSGSAVVGIIAARASEGKCLVPSRPCRRVSRSDETPARAGANLGAPERVVLQSGTAGSPFSFDEIRLGASFASVTPQAEEERARDATAAVQNTVDWI
jgi:hypothetical protein